MYIKIGLGRILLILHYGENAGKRQRPTRGTEPALGIRRDYFLNGGNMERTLQPITVYVSDAGYVCIKQPVLETYTDEEMILINVEQVDVIVKWLQEAKNEIRKGGKRG